MFVDASAIVAIIVREIEADALMHRVSEADRVYTSAIAIYETVLGVARALNTRTGDAESLVDDFLTVTKAEVIAIDAEIGSGAIRAFARFGRGQHPVRLNMGDCFAYACARALELPLLFKGDDFGQTDIAPG